MYSRKFNFFETSLLNLALLFSRDDRRRDSGGGGGIFSEVAVGLLAFEKNDRAISWSLNDPNDELLFSCDNTDALESFFSPSVPVTFLEILLGGDPDTDGEIEREVFFCAVFDLRFGFRFGSGFPSSSAAPTAGVFFGPRRFIGCIEFLYSLFRS